MDAVSNKNRIKWLDIYRGIGILLMVYGHICYSAIAYRWIYSFHMAIFFTASGYVYKGRNIAADIAHRARGILLPYISFGVITLLYWYFFERFYKAMDISLMQGFIGLLYGQYETLGFNIPLWFLPCFFLTMVIYNIIRQTTKPVIAFSFIAAMTVIYILIPLKPMPWGLEKVCKYLFFVMVGELLARYELINKLSYLPGYICIIADILLFAISLTLASKLPPENISWFATAIAGCCACTMLSLILSRLTLSFGPLQYIGRSAIITLCLHGPVYRALIGLTIHIAGIGMVSIRADYLYSGLAAIATVGICCALYSVGKMITEML